MNVTLGKLDGSVEEITRRLDSGSDIALAQQLERKAFQRSVDDIHLRCSNLAGYFTTLFNGAPPTTRWEVVVRSDTRILFRGEIENDSIDFKINDEWFECDVFAKTKIFWDRAKQTRIARATFLQIDKGLLTGSDQDLYITVEGLLKREITLERFEGVVAGYSIQQLYKDRPVRFWAYTVDRTIGNNGRYRDLDPRTTVDDLLKAMALYYNAEFFIDPQTQNLVMQKRQAILNDIQTDLSNVIESDEKIDIRLYDEQTVDYVGLALKLATPRKTELNGKGYLTLAPGEKGLGAGRYQWLTTFFYRSGDLIVESPAGIMSDPLELPKGGSVQVPNTYQALLKMPLGPTGVTGRRLYRTRNSGIGRLYHVLTIENNTDELRTDEVPDTSLGKSLPDFSASGNVWIRYDEAAGVWLESIIEDPAGLNRPTGKTFEVTPKLRFLAKPYGPTASEIEFVGSATWRGQTRTFVRTVTPHNVTENDRIKLSYTTAVPSVDGEHMVVGTTTPTDLFIDGAVVTTPGRGGMMQTVQDLDKQESLDVAEESILDAFAFFGGETNLDIFREQWQDLFRTKSKALLTAKGIDYRIGDSVLLNRSLNGLRFGKGVIRKAANQLMQERTQLEAVTL